MKQHRVKSKTRKERVMSKYLDPKIDIAFYKVFGKNQELIRSILNALLPLEREHEIVTIEYLPTEYSTRTPFTNYCFLNVLCKDNFDRQFIVELQVIWTSDFINRVLYHKTLKKVMQLDAGMHYDSIQPVYSLNLINDIYEKDDDNFYHHYQMTEKNNPHHVIEGIHLLFFELPKFKPQTITEKKMQVLWLRFLTEINGATKQAPAELLENAEVNKALTIVEESAFSDVELDLYDRFIDAIRWELTKKRSYARNLEKAKEQALAEGRAEGRAEGLAEGIHNNALSTASKMKEDGLSVDIIAKYTGLTLEEIAAI